MRNWHPFLADTLRDDARGTACGVRSGSSPRRSIPTRAARNTGERPRRARRLGAARRRDIDVTYVATGSITGFVEANARHVRDGARAPACGRPRCARDGLHGAQHPDLDGRRGRYREQLLSRPPSWPSGRRSRTGRSSFRAAAAGPRIPWLEPDICEYLRQERAAGLAAAVICPIGFVCDHIEVLYDLDREAAEVCQQLGLPMARAEAVNDDPLFLDMMADVVVQTIERYRGRRPMSLAMPEVGTTGSVRR